MAKQYVALRANPRLGIVVEEGATVGAQIGTDLRLPDGSVPTLAQLAQALGVGASTASGTTLWEQIFGVPPNLGAIAELNLAPNTFIARNSTNPLAALSISDFALSLVAAADRAATVAVLDIQADEVEYDNSTSGLAATEVQAAIDELAVGSGGGGDILPMVTGEVPPVLLYQEDGSLIYFEV